ncbi:MAG: tetratricopeptide repeat protein [Burkholderiales bacterium]
MKAQEALRAGHFKEAIEHYKELLKQVRNPIWLNALAEAYAGRANQLAAKDMVKEAVALWRTRADSCGVPLLQGPYLKWLMQAGEWEQMFGLLSRPEALPPGVQAQIETQLAGVALLAPEDILRRLPPDSLLLRHRSAACAALAAYAQGDDPAMNAQLQSIPFRSPYRDLRAILKAFALLPSDREQAAAAAQRIPAGGPFEALAAALRVCVLPGEEWLAPLGKLEKEARALVLDVKGCPPEQRPVVSELSLLRDEPAALYDWVVRHRQAFPAAVSAQICLRLLPHAPERIKAYRAAFSPLPVAGQERILALAAELKGNPGQAEQHWQRMVESVMVEPGQRMRAALVLSHLADSHQHGGAPGALCAHGIAWLAQSLDLDGEDRGTHLRLIRALRLHGTAPKKLRKRLDAAVAKFPKDAEILLEAMQNASESGAYKRAVGLAKRVLEFDPINSKVRSALGQAHLSHARKLMAAGNLNGARQELEEAAQWLHGPEERGATNLLQVLAAGQIDEAPLRAAVAALGGGLPGTFHLLLEALRTKRDAKMLLQRAGADLRATPPAPQVVAFARALNASPDTDKILRAALLPLEPMLQRAAALQFAEPDHLLVCEALHRRQERDLARRYAEAALKRWPGRPVFVYLRAEAIFGGDVGPVSRKELAALEDAWDKAKSQGDIRTAARLDELLSLLANDFGMPGPSSGLPQFPDLGPTSPLAAIEALLALGGEDVFLEMARKQFGNRTFDDLRRDIGGNKKQFVRALVDLFVNLEAGGEGAPGKFPPAPASPSKRRPALPGQKDFFDE